MSIFSAAMAVFFKGASVANPDAWKQGQVTASAIAGLVASAVELARALGYDVPLTTEQCLAIGTVVLLLVNGIGHVVRHDDVGLPRRDPSTPQAGGNPGGPVDPGGA